MFKITSDRERERERRRPMTTMNKSSSLCCGVTTTKMVWRRWCDRETGKTKRARNVFLIIIIIIHIFVCFVSQTREKEQNTQKKWNLIRFSLSAFGVDVLFLAADSDCVFLMLFLRIIVLNLDAMMRNSARTTTTTRRRNKIEKKKLVTKQESRNELAIF